MRKKVENNLKKKTKNKKTANSNHMRFQEQPGNKWWEIQGQNTSAEMSCRCVSSGAAGPEEDLTRPLAETHLGKHKRRRQNTQEIPRKSPNCYTKTINLLFLLLVGSPDRFCHAKRNRTLKIWLITTVFTWKFISEWLQWNRSLHVRHVREMNTSGDLSCVFCCLVTICVASGRKRGLEPRSRQHSHISTAR